jgi:hypothetical protein
MSTRLPRAIHILLSLAFIAPACSGDEPIDDEGEGDQAPPALMPRAATLGPRPDYQMPFPCGQTWRVYTHGGHKPHFHEKTDWSQPPSSGKVVVAPAAGRVTDSGVYGGGISYVTIDHGGGWSTRYLHMEVASQPRAGTQVEMGTPIGRVSNVGAPGGFHLHYEQYQNGTMVPVIVDGEQIEYRDYDKGEYATYTSNNCGQDNQGPYVTDIGGNDRAVVSSIGRVEAFVRGAGDKLFWTMEFGAGSWMAMGDLGGKVFGQPVAVLNGDGKTQVFVRGAGNILTRADASSYGNWSEWINLGGTTAFPPTVVRNQDGRLTVFIVDSNSHQLYQLRQYKAGGPYGWNGDWEALGGDFTTAPTAVLDDTGRIQIMARGGNGDLLVMQQSAPNAATYGAATVVGPDASAPASVTRQADGRVAAAYINGDRQLVIVTETAAGSATYSVMNLGGGVTSRAALVVGASNRLEVFVRADDGDLIHRWQDSPNGPTWSPWSSLGGDLRGGTGPLVARDADGEVRVIVVGTDAELYRIEHRANRWTGFSKLN